MSGIDCLWGHCIMTSCSRLCGSHGNLTKPDGGVGVGGAERDVMPKVNLWYEFYNCCCHVDRSILHLSFTKKLIPHYRTHYPVVGDLAPSLGDGKKIS